LLEVTKRFGRVEAVRGITLDVDPGELVTLLGPSGSGKTSTLMMVAGHETPDGGDIVIGGTNVTYLPAHRRNIGMVFQQFALFPHFTVTENVAFPLRMRRRSGREIETKVREALALVRLEGFGERHPHQLSGGQQQRVALARALVFDPAILLMDEPLSSLDKQLRENMQLEIKRLQRKLGITTLYVTHDQREALNISDRLVLLNHGRIEQIGTPEDIYDHPCNRFVADFIGESNFLTGRVAEIVGGWCYVTTSLGLAVRAPAPTAPVATGNRVTVVVRPEAVQIGVIDRPDANRVDGIVEEVTYYGEAVRVVARLGDEQLFIMRQGNSGLQRVPAPGDRITMSWAGTKTTILLEAEGS